MAANIVPEVNSAAKRIIYTHLEEAWQSVDRTCERIGALSQAIKLVLSGGPSWPHDLMGPSTPIAAAKVLADLMDEVGKQMWMCVDGEHSELRDTLGVKMADYEKETAHG